MAESRKPEREWSSLENCARGGSLADMANFNDRRLFSDQSAPMRSLARGRNELVSTEREHIFDSPPRWSYYKSYDDPVDLNLRRRRRRCGRRRFAMWRRDETRGVILSRSVARLTGAEGAPANDNHRTLQLQTTTVNSTRTFAPATTIFHKTLQWNLKFINIAVANLKEAKLIITSLWSPKWMMWSPELLLLQFAGLLLVVWLTSVSPKILVEWNT